jgi:dihydropteroate synthase
MTRKKFDWKLKREIIRLGERTLIVGALNVAPDSPIDDGIYHDADRAFVHAMEMADAGADIVEISAFTLKPGAAFIEEAEELRRLIPVLKRLRGKILVPICVETFKPAVAEKAIEWGAVILKDPTGLIIEPEIAKVAAKHDTGFIIQHMRGTPDQWAKQAPMKAAAHMVLHELGAAANRAVRAGVQQSRIVIDPGLGLGKRREQNTEILVGIDKSPGIELPIQVSPYGVEFAAVPPVDVNFSASVAATTAAILRGVHLIRTPRVAEFRAAALVTDALGRA